jgi:hypothetical protein
MPCSSIILLRGRHSHNIQQKQRTYMTYLIHSTP